MGERNEEEKELLQKLNQENKIDEKELLRLLDFHINKMNSQDEGIIINQEIDEEKKETSKENKSKLTKKKIRK